MSDARETLLESLAQHAYKFRPEDPFVLASGKTSEEYLDCKLAVYRPDVWSALGEAIYRTLVPSVRAVGGLTMGADPLAFATAAYSASQPRYVVPFVVRKEAKPHGQRKKIEGPVGEMPDETSVCVVDDVVTTGASTIKAIEECRAAGFAVVQVVVLVDREQNEGLAKIQEAAGAGVPVVPIVTKSEIKARWQQIQSQTPATLRATVSGSS
jgi:orotate phosphoribosyltransferase